MPRPPLDLLLLNDVAEQLQDGVAIFGPDDRLVFVNSRYVDLHPELADIMEPGVHFEELVRAGVERGFVVEAVGREDAHVEQRLNQHRNPRQPILRYRTDGRSYLIKESRLDDGSIVVTETEVTDIIAAQESLRESSRRFQDLAEIGSDWLWETDDEFRFTNLSDPAREAGLNFEGFIGKTRWELADGDPANDPMWARHKADLEAHRSFRDFRYSFVPSSSPTKHHRVTGGAVHNATGQVIGYRSVRRNDGGRRHFSVSGVPVFDREGCFTGYRGVAREISEQILAEKRAAFAHQRLLDAIEALPESFILCDADDRVVLCNSASNNKMPWLKAPIEPGMKFGDYLRDLAYSNLIPEARGHEDEWIRDRMKLHREPSSSREVRRTDGRWIQVSERRTADGGTVILRTDITDRKRAELDREALLTQVKEENRAKSTFLANLSHELRIPVNAIAELAAQITAETGTSAAVDGQKEAVAAIRSAALHLTELIDGALSISRLEVGRYALQPKPVETGAVIRECCNTVWSRPEPGAPALSVELPGDLPAIHVDEQAIRHILQCLLSDAYRYTPANCSVVVTAMDEADHVDIAVANDGPGIREEDVALLMRPFDRGAQDGWVTQYNGFGLGLTTAEALAGRMGGILSVASPADGGTIVTVRLPRSPEEASEAGPQGEEPPQATDKSPVKRSA